MVDIKINTVFTDRAKRVIKKYPNRAIDLLHCFSSSQEQSKMWLVRCLNAYLDDSFTKKYIDIAILGSWYGYLNYLIRKHLKCKLITEIRCYDVDDTAKKVGRIIFEDIKNLRFMTRDINDVDFSQQRFNIVINTSCEHMTDDTIHQWLEYTRKKTVCVLQSTNKQLRDHINTVNSKDELCKKFSKYFNNFESYEYDFDNHSRFMMIGDKK